MAWGEESLLGAGPTPGAELANVPLTTRPSSHARPDRAPIWYAHVLGRHRGQVSIRTRRAQIHKRDNCQEQKQTGDPSPSKMRFFCHRFVSSYFKRSPFGDIPLVRK